MIPVKVSLSLSNVGFVALLRPANDKRSLPIFIGAAEAQAIAFQLDKVEVPRPMTHDLLKNLLDCLECRLKRIEICDLQDNTFYARLIIENNAVETAVDSRPSDAIALALRCAAPILVAEEVIDKAGVILPEEAEKKAAATPKQAEHPESALEHAQNELQKAIQEERYEEAAKLRDQLRRMGHPPAKN